MATMAHAEFVTAWRAGKVAVEIDPVGASSFVSVRLLLPFVGVAIIGIGIALVLSGWLWTGLAVGALGIVVPRSIKASARHFLLSQIATDPDLYASGIDAGIIRVVAADSTPAA